MTENKMQNIEIEKMVLSCGAIGEKLDRSVKLLEMISGKKILKTKSRKRIPAFEISPGKESGCKVTLRNINEINGLLKRFFAAVNNKVNRKKIVENQFSFGIHEYIEIPGFEYYREIGILGFNVTVVFTRKGKRVALKKIKAGKYPKKQRISEEEIKEFLIKNLGVEVV